MSADPRAARPDRPTGTAPTTDHAVFLGTHQHTLDAKGRLILPAAFRDQLEGELVFAPGQERCIEVSRREAFEARLADLSTAPRETQRVRTFSRFLLAKADVQAPDKQGRVRLSATLREYGHLDRDVVVTGAGDHLEIWDRDRWEAYDTQAAEAFAGFDAPLDGRA